DALLFCARTPHWATIDTSDTAKRARLAPFIDASTRSSSPPSDRELFALLPFQEHDAHLTALVRAMLSQHTESSKVELLQILGAHGYLADLARAIEARENRRTLERAATVLIRLESLHKALVAYAWCHHHWPTSFYAENTARRMLRGVERAMDYLLREGVKGKGGGKRGGEEASTA
ncbi:hypothetical protein K488DRAFT_90530, partial [Vararia minispora EC-137]